MEHLEDKNLKSESQLENENYNYTSLPSDGPVSGSDPKEISDLQNTDAEDEDAISGDLAGNASGNEDAEEE